jgi:alpha-L-fucosidase
LNQGFGDGSQVNVDYAWPSDLMSLERWLPASNRGYKPWHHVKSPDGKEGDYYIPGEVCDPIGYEWFNVEGDKPRSDAELLGMRLIARERHANFLLDVPPDKHGVIPKERVDALMRLAKNVERFG